MDNALQSRARAVPAALRIPLIVLPLLLVAYWVVTDSGPYAWLADVQASVLDGEHFVVVSGVGATVLALLPAVALVQLLATFFVRRPH